MTSLRALVFAYLLGGLTFLPVLICAGLYVILYVTPPVGDPDPAKRTKNALQASSSDTPTDDEKTTAEALSPDLPPPRLKPLQGWVIARRTFEESPSDATYMGMMRSFLDSRSKDRRPRDTYYAVLKGTVLYLYEDEAMAECFAALDAGAYTVEIWPHEGMLDGELFAKRNCIRLSTKAVNAGDSPRSMATVSKNMKLADENNVTEDEGSERKEGSDKVDVAVEGRSKQGRAAFDLSQPWHLFIKNNSDMEDWYLALVQASSPVPVGVTDPSDPLGPIFSSSDMAHLVATLDAQPDAIPTRWLNALLGRLFFSVYRTAKVEAYILGRLASKLAKVKRPGFLTALSVREVSVGSRPPTVATPMLKELTRWGDAALELKFLFDGELRLTIAATAEVSLGARFRPYVVQLVLAVVIRKVEGNVLVKVKRPPSNRIWYAFTSMPKLEIDVLPVVSDREIKWGVVLKPIETQLKEIIRESIVMPNMDDIPFFESAGYEHRGGIWPDAARRQYNPEKDDPSTAPNPAIDVPSSTNPPTKGSSSAPPSVMGLATDESRPQSSTELPPVSESTPTLPLSPKSKQSATIDDTNKSNSESLAPNSDSARSRSPSPVGTGINLVEEQGLRKEVAKDRSKAAPAPVVVPSPKRTSWFSRTPVTLSSSSSPIDGPRGRTIESQSGAASAKATGANVRERSTPRSPVLLEAGESADKERASTSPARTSVAEVNDDTPRPESAAADTPTPAELPTQDTLPDSRSDHSSDPIPAGNNIASRSPTPILTINGTRRATVSHQTSKSAAGDFYSGGSISSSSLPPMEPPTTSVSSDSEVVRDSNPGTPPDALASSNVSSLNTPNDVPQVESGGINELARTLSNSSTGSLSGTTPLTTSTTTTTTDASTPQAVPQDANNAGANSFLSAWKSRTADKQALNNAAKEAMKKWTVGWNNLKRGVEEERDRRRSTNNTGGANTSGGTHGDTSGVEDEGSGSDAGMGGMGQAKKATGKKTFAELRAEVMSRREGAATPDSTGLSSSPKPRPTSLSVAPSAPRTTTEVQIGSPDIFDSPKPVIEQPKPIGVQPGRGATMMIPGIHASHQGEVMSLGSVSTAAEPLSPDKAHDKSADRERTLSQTGRPSSIQNVYRLFGQRTISTSSGDIANVTNSNEVLKQPKAAASSASIDTISVTPVDDEPPAEPPFSLFSPFSPLSPSTPRSGTPAPLLPPRPVPNIIPPTPRSPPPALPPRKDSVTMSAASEALKKLAADDAARTSRPHSPHVGGTTSTEDENTSGTSTPNGPQRAASPPPLPPRAPVTAS